MQEEIMIFEKQSNDSTICTVPDLFPIICTYPEQLKMLEKRRVFCVVTISAHNSTAFTLS